VHESVFRQYNDSVAAAQTEMPVAETMVAPPVNPFSPATPAGAPASPFASPPSGFVPPPAVTSPAVASPVISAPMSYSAGSAVPPWQQWASRGGDRSRTLYLAGAFIAVALGVILTIYFVSYQLPFLRADNQNGTTPTPAATPTPHLTQRSDSAVAARYVTSVITPAVSGLSQPFVNYREACNGTLSFSCQQALQAVDTAVKDGLARFTQSPPACIAAQAAKIKVDLTAIQAGTAVALKAYNDNNRTELVQGLSKFNSGSIPIEPDVQAINNAQAACDNLPQGP
jgi:hypothetical protein